MATTDEALQRLKATGKIDTLGTTNPGWIIDLYNQQLTDKMEKSFQNHISDMNEYYFKLLIDTVKQKQSGIKNPIYKSSTTLINA